MDRERIAPFERAELPGYFGGVAVSPGVVAGGSGAGAGAGATGSSSRVVGPGNMSSSRVGRREGKEMEMEILRMGSK